jgi:hypothetical protein
MEFFVHLPNIREVIDLGPIRQNTNGENGLRRCA